MRTFTHLVEFQEVRSNCPRCIADNLIDISAVPKGLVTFILRHHSKSFILMCQLIIRHWVQENLETKYHTKIWHLKGLVTFILNHHTKSFVLMCQLIITHWVQENFINKISHLKYAHTHLKYACSQGSLWDHYIFLSFTHPPPVKKKHVDFI